MQQQPILTSVDSNPDSQQQSAAVLASDVDVDFNDAEPRGIPLALVQPPPLDLKMGIQNESDIIEVKTVSDQQLELKAESNSVIALYIFLNQIGINRADIQQAGISESHLLKLFQKETGCGSFLQWCSFDHIVEKNLQWPLLSPKEVGESAPESWLKRVRPHGRSILLKSTWGFIKAYGARGFVKGVEASLAKSVHYFIYAMLIYRLIGSLQVGQGNFVELRDLFQGSNQKGIDSLVVSLAKIAAQWLKLILVSPLIIGALQSGVSVLKARKVSSVNLQKITQDIAAELNKPSRFCRDTVREMFPLLNQIISLSSKIQRLEQLVRWDGRLSIQDRHQSFEIIRRAAKDAHQMAQLNSLESLAKIAHGVGLKDLPRLHTAGYSKNELLEILYAKTTALSDLEELSRTPNRSWKAKLTAAPRRVYATYLLWWLGLSTSFLKQRLPFFLFKAGKLTLEIFFLQQIVNSILEAIRCPDKPGFKFGDGYQDWASDYTAECFTTRISLFRRIYANESIDELVAEISQYRLTELTSLNLYNKYLTEDEASQIIQAVLQQKAPLKILDLSVNQLTFINQGMFDGLTQLNFLHLDVNQLSTLNDDVFNALTQLNSLDLSLNQLTTLSEGVFNALTQLNSLDLSLNPLSTLSEGVFSRLTQLNTLSLENNRLITLSDGIFRGLSQLNYLDLSWGQLSTLNNDIFNGLSQLNSLNLWYNQLSALGDDMFMGLNQLRSLYLGINDFNITALMNILNQLPSSLTFLDITGNPISYIPQNFSTLLPISLQSLWIGGNYVPETLTQEFMKHFPTRLNELTIRYSSVVNITPDCFLDFSHLTFLSLVGNQLSNLSDDVFSELTQLNYLDLSSNLLSKLSDGVFSQLTQLNYLDLGFNQLSTFSDNIFSKLTQLNYLDLSSNLLSKLSDDVFSQLTQLNFLYLGYNQLNTVNNNLFNRLSQLNNLALYFNLLSTLSDDAFTQLTQLNGLDLSYNQLNDNAIKNLTRNFPYQLNALGLSYNQIGNEGALALAEILPCTSLSYLFFVGNPANDTSLILATQEKALRKVCEDKRCHANLPATQSCGIQSEPDSTSVSQMTWGTQSASYAFFTHHSSDHLNPLALPHSDFSPISENSLFTPTQIGATLIGVMGLGLLLYKNAPMVRNVVNVGYRLLQRCFYRTTESLKISTNLCSFHLSHKKENTLPGPTPTTTFRY